MGGSAPDWQKVAFFGLVAVAMVDVVRTLRPYASSLCRKHAAPQPALAPTAASPQSDQPVASLSEDQLGFAKYACVLAEYIVNWDTPLTLGIHGRWGSGKTSLANLIRHFLTPRRGEVARQWQEDRWLIDIRRQLADAGFDLDKRLRTEVLDGLEIIPFNAWQYGSSESLWRALILQISKRLAERGLDEPAAEWTRRLYCSVSQEEKGEIKLSRAAVFLAGAQAAFAYGLSLVLPSTWLMLALRALGVRGSEQFRLSSLDDVFEGKKFTLMRKQMDSIEEFQAALRTMIEQLLASRGGPEAGRRVVFFIDDLDRCLPEVALQIMETIKTFLDVEGCVYVLLCDFNLLGQGVRAKFRGVFDDDSESVQRRGREYVEKIIQVSFQIPPSSEHGLRRYAEASLRELYENRGIPYFDVVYATVGNNPRKLKRLCRGLELAFDMMQVSLARGDGQDSASGEGQGARDTTNVQPQVVGGGAARRAAGKDTATRRQEFAKVYCLQYGWPDTLPLLHDFQARGELPPLRAPASVEALLGVDETQPVSPARAAPENLNLVAGYRAIEAYLKDNDDYRIFSDALLSVNWDKVRASGGGGIEVRNQDLWLLLGREPYFSQMNTDDLRDYIEWSGVLRETQETAEEAKIRDILGRHRDDLMRRANVVGVEVGDEVSSGRRTGRTAIRVLVRVKLPGDQLSRADLLPSKIEGTPVDVVQVGRPPAKHGPEEEHGAEPAQRSATEGPTGWSESRRPARRKAAKKRLKKK